MGSLHFKSTRRGSQMESTRGHGPPWIRGQICFKILEVCSLV
jgi:hypothetical protein